MPRSLFLGLGKSNTGLASVVPGDKQAFVENENHQVEVYHYEGDRFVLSHSLAGSFDTIDWSPYSCDQVFVSPGIDPRRPFMNILGGKEVRELDYVATRFAGKMIAITGTDGKSTMTVQTGEVLRRAFSHLKIFVGGNLGTPMADVLKDSFDWAVLEVSSFQAERLRRAQIHYGILLNLAPDHLDRYDSIENYYGAKWELISRSQKAYFPRDVLRPDFIKRQSLCDFSNQDEISVILKQVVSSIMRDEGMPVSDELFQRLPRLPHRQEVWRDHRGAFFVNDSKATTVHATAYALKHLGSRFSRLHWILGGRYKGDNFSDLLSGFRETDSIYVVGEAASVIQGQLSQRGEVFDTLRTCLENVLSKIEPGEALVLSPACSSYDEFDHFEQRGDFFLSEVRKRRGTLIRDG